MKKKVATIWSIRSRFQLENIYSDASGWNWTVQGELIKRTTAASEVSPSHSTSSHLHTMPPQSTKRNSIVSLRTSIVRRVGWESVPTNDERRLFVPTVFCHCFIIPPWKLYDIRFCTIAFSDESFRSRALYCTVLCWHAVGSPQTSTSFFWGNFLFGKIFLGTVTVRLRYFRMLIYDYFDTRSLLFRTRNESFSAKKDPFSDHSDWATGTVDRAWDNETSSHSSRHRLGMNDTPAVNNLRNVRRPSFASIARVFELTILKRLEPCGRLRWMPKHETLEPIVFCDSSIVETTSDIDRGS